MNTETGLFQTLVAAASAAADNLAYENALVEAAYWDFKPVVATPNTSLSVIIPTVNEADVTDIGSGPINVTSTDHNSVNIPYNKHYSTSFVIKAWDQARTPQDLERTYLRPRFEALLRAVNRSIVNLFTDANVGTGASPIPGYAMQTGATSQSFSRKDINIAWTLLTKQGVPMTERENLFFVTGPTAFGNMLSDQNFNYSYIVGDNAALAAQQDAKLQFIYGGKPRYDQHIEEQATALGFSEQPGIMMHRYAVACVTAQPAPLAPQSNTFQEQIIWLKEVLPVQIQVGPSLEQQGTIVHIHCYWGSAIARANFACRINSAA